MEPIHTHTPHRRLKLKALTCIVINALMMNTAIAADYTVTSTTDDGNTATVGSLSWAITQANLTSGNTIIIDPSVTTITATGTLPTLTQPVTISSDHNIAITGTLNTDVLTTLSGGGTFSFVGSDGSNGSDVGDASYAGGGGQGDLGIDGSNYTLTNSGSITGGNGGNGGNAGIAGFGGIGGQGGSGISGSNFTLTNSGSITGGNGGNGGNTGGSTGGDGGQGGSGIDASGNVTIHNTGTITIGAGGGAGSGTVTNGSTGTSGTNAIVFSGGGNKLYLSATSVINGNVTSASGITNGGDSLFATNTTITGSVSGFNTVSLLAGNNVNSTITGDFTQSTAGVLKTQVTDDTTYGKLVVTGTAILPSNAKIDVDVTNPNFSFTSALTNGMADIISASTLTSDGTFAVTDNSLLFNFDAVKDGNTVDLTLSAAAPAVLTSTTNQGKTAGKGAASVIDGVISSNPTGALASHFVSLTTEPQVANAVESTLPGLSGGVAQATNIAINAVTSVVASRQGSTRGLSSGDNMMTDRHVWLKPFGGWTKQGNRQGVTGYDIDSYGLALGFDGDVSASWNIGVALAYVNSDVNSNLASGRHAIDMDSYLAKVYATHMLDDDTALNLQLGAGTSDYASHRRIFTGDVASADYDSWEMQASAELERSYSVSDRTVLTPYVHADYSYVDVEKYTETGAGALNLNTGSDSADSLVIGAGIKAHHTMSEQLQLMANAGIGYDVMTDRSRLTSSFAGGGANFTTEGVEPDEIVYVAGLGAEYSLENETEITVSYDFSGRQDYTDQSISANVRFMF